MHLCILITVYTIFQNHFVSNVILKVTYLFRNINIFVQRPRRIRQIFEYYNFLIGSHVERHFWNAIHNHEIFQKLLVVHVTGIFLDLIRVESSKILSTSTTFSYI